VCHRDCGTNICGFATVWSRYLLRWPARSPFAALEKHICRCTGYVRYYQAVRDVILATPGLTRGGA